MPWTPILDYDYAGFADTVAGAAGTTTGAGGDGRLTDTAGGRFNVSGGRLVGSVGGGYGTDHLIDKADATTDDQAVELIHAAGNASPDGAMAVLRYQDDSNMMLSFILGGLLYIDSLTGGANALISVAVSSYDLSHDHRLRFEVVGTTYTATVTDLTTSAVVATCSVDDSAFGGGKAGITISFTSPIYFKRITIYNAAGAPTPSFTASPTSITAGTTGNVITLTGTSTSWTGGTTFSLTGGTGASITAQSVNATAQTASLTITAGSAAGTLTIHDSTDSATATITVNPAAPPALVAGTVSYTSSDATSITFSATAASGGTAPIAKQWYFGTSPGGATLQSGQTGATFTKSSGLAADTDYFASVLYTDSATPTPQTATAFYVPARLNPTSVVFGAIGDSITYGYGLSAGQDPVTQLAIALRSFGGKTRNVTAVNRGYNGATTAMWDPGGSIYANALAAFAPGTTWVSLMLGTNDAIGGVSANTYSANLTAIVNALVTAGYKVLLHYPPYPLGASGFTAMPLMQTYYPKIDAIVAANPGTVYAGDKIAPAAAGEGRLMNQGDGVHDDAAGAALHGGVLWAQPFATALGWVGTASKPRQIPVLHRGRN